VEAFETILTILGMVGFASVSMGFVLKTYLTTGIKESIGSIYKKKLEEHKFLLKNSEKIFEYKLNASKALYKILHDILPKRNNPEMEWSEACEEIASSFSAHEKALDEFLCNYQSTLSDEILERVKRAVSACSDGGFEFYWSSSMDEPACSETGKDKADELYNALSEAVDLLRKEVNEMISLPNT